MGIVVAWAIYLTLIVVWLVLGAAWLAPRLPRAARTAIIWAMVGAALLAMAISARLAHDYRPSDLHQLGFAGKAVFGEILLAVIGGAAVLATGLRQRANHPGLLAAGIYLTGVGVLLYRLLAGEASVQAPLLLLAGGSIGVSAACRLARLPAWLAAPLALAAGGLIMLEAEGWRGSRLGSGAGPGTAPGYLLPLLALTVTVALTCGVLLVRRHRTTLAPPLIRATLGLAGTGLVLLLRGSGEWLPSPGAGSTTLYGLPLTLLLVAVSLAIADWPATARQNGNRPAASPLPRYALATLALAAPPLLLAGLVGLWHPAPERCTAVPYAQSSALTPGSPVWASSPDAAAPRVAPDIQEFDKICLDRTAGLGQLVYAIYPSCKWAQVDPNYPLIQASGTLQEIDMSPADSPWLHTSHDLEFDVAVDPASEWLVLGDDGARPTLHVEAETGPFPAAYRPVAGDRVTVAGRWIFDCGHDAKTELHPAAVVAAEHDEWRTELGGAPQQVRVIRVWMNSAPGLVHVPLAPFELHTAFPDGQEATPAVRVVAGDPGAVRWTVDPAGARADIQFVPPAQDGSAYFELLLGSGSATAPAAAPATYTVAFDRLVVHDDFRQQARNTGRELMGGLPADLINPQIGIPGTGNWYMDVIAGDTWRTLLTNATVRSGRTYSLTGVAPVQLLAPGDDELRFAVTGYADNDPSDGVALGSGIVDGDPLLQWDAGRFAGLCCDQERAYTPPNGAWTLYYHVSRIGP